MNSDRIAALVALSAAYQGDALFRPSSIDRVIGCPGSVRLVARAPRERRLTSYIVEGLAAHKVAEEALKGIRQPDEWSDRMVRVDDTGMQGAFVDEEMVLGIGSHIDVIEADFGPGVERFVEQKLSLQPLDPDDLLLGENRGTADTVQVDHAKRRLSIYDLKWGRGVMVAGDSPQVKNYALMGLVNYAVEGGWSEVETVISQPRAADPRQRLKRFVFHPNDLLTDFLGSLVGAMEAALNADPPLHVGTWCRWCPARAICPALRDQALHIADDPFEGRRSFRAGDALVALPATVWVGTLEEPRPRTVDADRIVLPSPVDLDPGEIGTILSRRHLFDAWISAVEHRAVALMDTGTIVPGWDIDRRTGHRRWKDAEHVLDSLRALGLSVGDAYTEPKLKSPAQVEKLLPPAKRDAIEALVERPLGPVVLVPAERRHRNVAIPPSLGPIE